MLRAIRRNGILPFVMLLVTAGSIPLQLSALIHDDGRDPCEPTLVFHDESAHRIGGVHGRAPEPEHCAICHWLQSLRTIESVARVAQPVAESRAVAVAAVLETRSAPFRQLPARAPPLA